jgi:hypothetical protein
VPDPASIRLALLVAVSVGYAALLARMMATGNMWRFPAFWSLLFITTLKSATWIFPAAMASWRPLEWAVVGLKALAALEAFYWVARGLSPPVRVRLLVGLLVAAGIGVAVASRAHEEPPGREWVRTRQISHVGLASFALAGCAWWWARLSRVEVEPRAGRHALILTAWLVAYAASGAIDYKAGATAQRRMALYHAQGLTFRVPTLFCLAGWWVAMRRRD